MCKSDDAPEFMSACTTLGFVHEPSLSNRWPHNSVIEREIRTLEEVARFHLLTDIWQHSVQYAAIVINAYHPVKDNGGNPHNRHMLASGKEIVGRELLLGQLVFVRKDPLNRRKFDANAVSALFIETALADFSEQSLAELDPKEVPFSSLPSDATPAPRHEYITLDRIIRFGATPDCRACSEMKGRHNSRCKARFDTLVKAEKAAKPDKSPLPPADGVAPVEDLPSEAVGDESVAEIHPRDLPFSAGMPPGDPEAAMINKVASTIDESFIQASNQRSKNRRMNTQKGHGTLFEFACSDGSVIGKHAIAIGAKCIRLSRSTLDLCSPDHVQQALGQLETMPGADTWASVTCTHHTQIPNLKLARAGKSYAKKLEKRKAESEVLLQYAMQFLERTLELGGRGAFELPAGNQLWNNPRLLAFEERAGMKRVYFNGCALNLRGKHGKYLKKPWCVTTSDLRLIQFLSQCQCDKAHEHEESLGKKAAQFAFYTPEFPKSVFSTSLCDQEPHQSRMEQ